MRHLVFLFSGAFLLTAACAPKTSVKMKQATTVEKTEKVESKYTGPKRRIGVVDFQNKAPYAQGRIGDTATDIMITELVKTGKFIVVERDKLNKILDEQKLGQTGAIDPNTAAQVGKILGLNALLTGSVSQFGVKKEGKDLLITQSKQQIVECTVDVRVVDTETGQVLFADSGKGVVRKATGQILGMGNKSKYDETLEGEALRAAIVQFMENLTSQVNKKPWSCRVAAVEEGSIYLNAGLEAGLEVGQKLKVFSQGKEIKDPTTGLVIGRTEREIATIKVLSHFGDDGAVATVISGSLPNPTALCRLAE
ncbi:MAG: CsgG/HfaB family protein [Elusimicrobia bacterium]|nr:CsgG/HfaB family protein [Candidatus Obscuribacterium magneticum]